MEELFRFILARPIQAVNLQEKSLGLQASENLSKKLKNALSSSEPFRVVNEVAAEYSRSVDGIKSIRDLKYGTMLENLASLLAENAQMSLSDLSSTIKEQFGMTPNKLYSDGQFKNDLERLMDVIVTNSILGYDYAVSSGKAAQLLRAGAIIERVVSNDATLADKGGLTQALKRVILLPSDIFPLTRTAKPKESSPIKIPKTDSTNHEMLLEQHDRLFSTYKMLTRFSAEHYLLPESTGFDPKSAPKDDAQATLPPMVRANKVGEPTEVEESSSPMAFQGSPPKLMLKPTAIAAIGDRERAVLSERNLDLTQVGLKTAVDRLLIELKGINEQLTKDSKVAREKIVKIGGDFYDGTVVAYQAGGEEEATVGAEKGVVLAQAGHGHVTSVGIGDLLVVKQFLKRYEGGELAHVENVLKGEFKERMHRRARTTEETITTETEIKREEERDQQTTERFELKTESSEIQKQDTSFKIGLSLSGSYGPLVEFKASTDFGLNTSKEESSKVANSYSKDVTNRATSRILDRRREERILKTIEVFEEKNTHGVHNESGTEHVVGQYQWLDKVYEAQVYNYGKRMLLDIMIPEPAAFMLYAMGEQKLASDLVKPLDPDSPEVLAKCNGPLNETNYDSYASLYETVGVTPPPEFQITMSKVFDGTGTTAKSADIPIPDGYKFVGMGHFVFNANLSISLGGLTYTVWNDKWSGQPTDAPGSIPLAIRAKTGGAWSLAVRIWCQLTERALEDWKIKAKDKILQSYQKQLRDYEEKLAAIEVQAAQQIQGRNPKENEQLIRTELKKHATSIFTAQFYDSYGAIGDKLVNSHHYPEIKLNKAEVQGKFIRFFEQAFEWENMMYFFYPYYWGRKKNWLNRALLEDVDPLFAEFLKSGSARLVVPVRRNFDQAVAYYFETGGIWNGGDLPDIASPLYVSIIEEIRERDEAPGDEISQGNPWDVHLPTTLVMLRTQATLPAWQKNQDGEWVPV